MATGYEQARSVAAHLAGDEERASQVHLVLPESGACGLPGAAAADQLVGAAAAACCG